MKRIPLTQGKVSSIDDEDYSLISLFKWYAIKDCNTFYAVTSIKSNNKKILLYMHRLILNSKLHELTDHRDMDGLNNQKSNLRKCTNSQNHMNRRKRKNCFSQYKGVTRVKGQRKKRWVTQIKINGKNKCLGYFHSEIEAAKSYNKKAKELFREFAHLNKIP